MKGNIHAAAGLLISAAIISAVTGGCGRQSSDQNVSSADTSSTDARTAEDARVLSTNDHLASAGTSHSSGGINATISAAGNALDDTALTAKVKGALLADSDIKGLDVTVESNKGEVMLSGYVNNQAQIERAAKLARDVQGVQVVNNKLEIKR